MSQYNPKIHHRRTIRLQGYDYSRAGLYFITICCENREHRFGKIENNEMILNDAGKIAEECWLEIPNHFPNAILHEHIIMPNHIHGIIQLKTDNIGGVQNAGVQNFEPLQQNIPPIPVGVENFQPLPRNGEWIENIGIQHFEPQRNKFQKIIPRSIGSIVRGYKIGVTKWYRNNGDIEKIWQRNFHEHIIRDEKSYRHISNYIINNPAKWRDDKFYNQ